MATIDTSRATVFDATAVDSLTAGQPVQIVVDPTTGDATVRRVSLCCVWCPTYAHPDPVHHPNGQPEHVVWAE